jgi:hypothetical protein
VEVHVWRGGGQGALTKPSRATKQSSNQYRHLQLNPTSTMIRLLLCLLLIAAASICGALIFLQYRRRRLGSPKDDVDDNTKSTGAESVSFAEGDRVDYCKRGSDPLSVVIDKIHLDDELVPYYTIRLPDGSEKQTVGRYLKLDSNGGGDNDDDDGKDDADLNTGEDTSTTMIQRLQSNPWIVFLFYTSRDAKAVVLREAVSEAIADLDLTHSWPRLGPSPRYLGLLWLLGFVLGMDWLTRVALIGFKLFAARYALRLPYTYLTQPCYSHLGPPQHIRRCRSDTYSW